MRELTLKAAATEIYQTCQQSKEQGLLSPFFFMVGAGISHPPLPLAAELQAHFKNEAEQYDKTTLPSQSSAIDAYSHWFEQAYPQPENRQQYLRALMEKAFISRANFRLAHLLLEKTVANLVVTTNFDDFLSRALTLFGRRHIVCDHPKTLERISLQSKDVQIIHLHGSYWFYDCCNLKAEIADRATPSASTSFTMLSMLGDILRTHSPLVVGYSGWEGDVFMNALRRRLTAGLRTNLYWFCYKDARSLPEWLTSHSNVCLVLPERGALARKTGVNDQSRDDSGTNEDESGPRAAGVFAGSDVSLEEPMQARAVFDELIRRFALEAPALTKDPVGFFCEQLRSSLLGDREDDPQDDIYAIRSVIEGLAKLKEQQDKVKPSETEGLLERFRNEMRQSKIRDAIGVAAQLQLEKLEADQLLEISSALSVEGPALDDNSDDELRAYDLIAAIGDRLALLGRNQVLMKVRTGRALFNKGVTLGALNRGEEEIAVYDEVVRRFGEATEPALRAQVAKAQAALDQHEDDEPKSAV